MDLYQFTDSLKNWKGSAARVCIGPRSAISAFMDRDEMETLFGGYIIYESSGGDQYMGVWGGRKASRLRRMLRERGATLHLLPDLPPGLRVKITAVHYNSTKVLSKSA